MGGLIRIEWAPNNLPMTVLNHGSCMNLMSLGVGDIEISYGRCGGPGDLIPPRLLSG